MTDVECETYMTSNWHLNSNKVAIDLRFIYLLPSTSTAEKPSNDYQGVTPGMARLRLLFCISGHLARILQRVETTVGKTSQRYVRILFLGQPATRSTAFCSSWDLGSAALSLLRLVCGVGKLDACIMESMIHG